ncbi:unnamed protein product [Trichobilharzia szidati]|nr:unnamed protein product [Trichobilharzia szidati]
MDSECTSTFCDDFNSSFGFYSNVNSPPYHDNYINHTDHYHCNCTENVNSSGPVTPTTTSTTTTPMNNPSTVKMESFQGRNEQSMSPMLSCVSPFVNSETHVISNSVGIQLKNNSNNSNSQPSVSFASSPRGNTVITHHPSSPFARVPRGPILKNEGNLKMPVQSSQPSTGSRVSTYSTVGDTVTATSTSASANAAAYSDNLSNEIPIPITDASTNSSSVVSNESLPDSSKSSSKQSVRVNESQRTNSVYYESSQPAYIDDKIKSVGALTPMHNNTATTTTSNNNNNPMGSGRGRPNVSSSYPTYEEAWDVKLARQLGVGVSRLPSILPISPTTATAAAAAPPPTTTTAAPNHIPSLPSILTGGGGGGATPPQNSSSVCNKGKATDDVQTVETDFKLLNITTTSNSSDDKSAKLTNFSEMLITDDNNKNVYDDGDCNYKNKQNGKSVNGINQLFYHNETNNDPSQRNSISSHMINGKTELAENSTGEYDYAYNGSWNMGVKYNLNLAINNSSNDSSIIPTTPKYTNTPTTGITKTVKSSHSSNTIHSSNPHHHSITSTPLPPPPPPAVPSHHHHHHHPQKYGISSSQSQESSRLNTIRNDTNDFKGRPTSRPVPSVIPNDLDSISTDSCDESWDARHGQLVSELMRGRFIDPSVIVPTTSGKMMNPVTATVGMTTESLHPMDKNASIIPGSIPATSSSCTSSSSSTPSSSSSSSSSSASSTTSSSSTSVPLPSPLSSQCINAVAQLSSDQFNSSNGLRYPGNSVNKTKLSSSSQNNLPKGLPPNLENLPLEEQPWFHPSLTRSEAEELIRNEPEGSFLVRPSETCPNDFSLTIKHKSFLHMRISRNSAGQYILGEYSQPYTSVSQMIYHYARTLVPVLGAYSVTLTHPVLKRI